LISPKAPRARSHRRGFRSPPSRWHRPAA